MSFGGAERTPEASQPPRRDPIGAPGGRRHAAMQQQQPAAGTGGGTGRTAAPADADSRDRTGSEDWLTGVPCEGPTYTHTHALRHEYERVCVYWATSTIVEHHVSLDLVELCDGQFYL